jgi:hypothetical protein
VPLRSPPTEYGGDGPRKAATSTADDKAKQMFEEMFKMAVKADPTNASELKKQWEREFGKVEEKSGYNGPYHF